MTNRPLVVLMRATRCLLSSWIHASIPLRPIPKSLKVESVNRLSWRQRSPLLMPRPDRGESTCSEICCWRLMNINVKYYHSPWWLSSERAKDPCRWSHLHAPPVHLSRLHSPPEPQSAGAPIPQSWWGRSFRWAGGDWLFCNLLGYNDYRI